MLNLQAEAARCLLCTDAPCGAKAARAVRAIRFDNEACAAQIFATLAPDELEQAESRCIHYDRPLRLVEMAAALSPEPEPQERPSLAITFCGIPCENPFFLASSAVCTNYDMVARAFRAGWAGVFYKTICLQDIEEVSPRFDALNTDGHNGDFYAFRNMEQLSENPHEVDFDILRRLKQDFPTKVVVASIMGSTEDEWVVLAQMAERAGCDAVELNFSCPQMKMTGMGSDVGQNSELVTFYTAFVKRAVRIPVIPKMTPNVAHMAPFAMASYFAGADGISAINTIKSITMNPRSEVDGRKTISGLSGRAVKPIALRFIEEIATNPFINHQSNPLADRVHANIKPQRAMHISGIGGIETWRDALEFIQMGCRNVQVCTAVMQYGYRIIDDLPDGLSRYMASRGIVKLSALVGEALPDIVLPADLDRTTRVLPAFNRDRCAGCGRCYVSCTDGGHQAITFDPQTRRPQLNARQCVGCHLCLLVCPTGAIRPTRRIPKQTCQ